MTTTPENKLLVICSKYVAQYHLRFGETRSQLDTLAHVHIMIR